MTYVNLALTDLASPAFQLATHNQQGVWLCLMRYCCLQENRGRIDKCKRWTNLDWARICGITAKDVRNDSTLWKWDKSDLLVEFYSHWAQDRSEAQRRGAEKTNQARQKNAQRTVSVDAQRTVSAQSPGANVSKVSKVYSYADASKENGAPPLKDIEDKALSRQWAVANRAVDKFAQLSEDDLTVEQAAELLRRRKVLTAIEEEQSRRQKPQV